MFLNVKFEDKVIISNDSEFVGCEFASGDTPNEKGVFALQINGNSNVLVKDCVFNNKGYSSIYLNSTGRIDIENNEFSCSGVYNPIEGNSSKNSAPLNNIHLKKNKFNGICGNNYINFYNVADNATIRIKDTVIRDMSQQSECIRLSNINNTHATFIIDGIDYSYDMNTQFDSEYTKMILCQDYTGDQDFGKFTIQLNNVKCNGKTVSDENDFSVGGLLCVYRSGTTPVINFN